MHSTGPSLLSRRALLKASGLGAAAVVAGPSFTSAAAPATTTALSRLHRILTCNILLDLPEHKGTPFDWAATRRDACFNLIHSRRPDIACLQEVGPTQNEDLRRSFPGFTVFGYDDPYVDHRPKRFQSIKNVILFSNDRYEIVSGGTYWLSATPHVVGSRLPDEGGARHVTWVRLRDRATQRHFRVLDTHLGLKQPVRLEQTPIIVAEAEPYAPDFPQLLCGDLNSTAASDEQRVLQDAGWHDTAPPDLNASVPTTTAPVSSPHSNAAKSSPPTTAPITAPVAHRRIDYIYAHGAVRSIAAALFRSPDPKRPASDHPFVSADVQM